MSSPLTALWLTTKHLTPCQQQLTSLCIATAYQASSLVSVCSHSVCLIQKNVKVLRCSQHNVLHPVASQVKWFHTIIPCLDVENYCTVDYHKKFNLHPTHLPSNLRILLKRCLGATEKWNVIFPHVHRRFFVQHSVPDFNHYTSLAFN